jgi:hypothetical protein
MEHIVVDLSTGEQTIVPFTEKEVVEFEASVAALNTSMSYAEKRAGEYPDFREYLDGIVKGDQAQIDAYVAACLAVKAKYPKV